MAKQMQIVSLNGPHASHLSGLRILQTSMHWFSGSITPVIFPRRRRQMPFLVNKSSSCQITVGGQTAAGRKLVTLITLGT